MKKILIIGDVNPRYHPLSNLDPLLPHLGDYEVKVSHDYDDILSVGDYSLFISYTDTWQTPLNPQQSKALLDYLNNQGKMLMIHNGIALQGNPEILELLKCKFLYHPEGEVLDFRFNDLFFSIREEPYQLKIDCPVSFFGEYLYQGKSYPAGFDWIDYNITYLVPGHEKKVFEHPTYIKVILSCIARILG